MKNMLAEEATTPAGFKTKIWEITTKDRKSLLGLVKWYAPWRKYTFFPTQGSLFDNACLLELAEFVKEKTIEHKG